MHTGDLPGREKRGYRRCAAALLCAVTAMLTACGGGGGGGSPSPPPPPPPPVEATISGTVQKGLFQALEVTATPVDSASGDLGAAVDATITGQDYSIAVAPNQLTLLEATGTFTSEIDGSPVELDRPLRLLVQVGSANVSANINFATTIAAELALRDLASSALGAGALIEEKNDFTAAVLGMPAGTNPSTLDFANITDSSDMTDPNLQLLIYGGGIVQILDSDRFYAGGFGDLLEGILEAGDLQAATGVLGILNGLSAGAIYDLSLQHSGYSLPTMVLGNDFFVLVCLPLIGCSWNEVTDPSVSVAASTAWEAFGSAKVYVRLNEASAEDVSVRVSVASGTAAAGRDFIARSETVTVPAGELNASAEIEVIIDALAEPEETALATIVSLSDAYPVFQGSANVTIRDGAPRRLDGQDAAGIEILSLDLVGVCNPVIEMMRQLNCVEVTGQEDSLGIVDGRVNVADTALDLAADCADAGNCPQAGTDWLVDFFLVAKDNGGTVADVALGPYIYKPESVQLVSDPPLPRRPLVRLTDDSSVALANDALANGWDLELEARIGAANTVAAADVLPPLVTVPGQVLVGETLLDIGVVYDVMPGADFGCALGQYAIDAQYSQTGTEDFLGITVDIPLGSGTLCVDYDPGGVTAGPAVMVEGRLDLFGGVSDAETAILSLPPGLYGWTRFEVDVPGLGALGGDAALPFLWLTQSPGPGGALSVELHHEGWPFTFYPDLLALTPDGIELGYSDMRYVMDVGYSSQDPRSLGILYSNDIFYRGVDGQGGTLLLGPNGVSGGITVAGGPGFADHTAYPRARVEWQDFGQAIVVNEIEATTLALDEFRLSQATSCRGPDCVQGQRDEFSVSSSSLALDGRGYAIGDAVNAGAHDEPRFGARADGTYAWSRPDDLAAQQRLKIAIPGYTMPADAAASDFLVAHLDEPAAPGDIEIYPLGSDEFTDGNYHPTGISVGPEIYRDATGIPVTGDGQTLTGNSLRLDNGSDAAFNLQSSPAVKYVIRNAGITGVFNVESATLGGSTPQFYGYALDLTRFAVRSVDNVLDSHTWIDGRLALEGDAGGPAGLDIFFTNLEIDCSARLGNVDLLYEACDMQDNNGNGFTDENCSPVLYSWKSETDIFAAGFRGGGPGDACAVTTQTFGLEHQMHFAALDKPVAFDTEWDAGGLLASQVSGQLPAYRFDRSDEGDGFPVRTSGTASSSVQLGAAQVDGDGYGWLEFASAQVGVPFWNALETDLRVANAERFGEIVAEPTVVIKQGELGNSALNAAQRNKDYLIVANSYSEQNDPAELKADYRWGNTGFGFTLPVYYQPWQLDRGQSDPDAQGRQSRFLGRQLTKDLFVLDASAGINFIEPDRTKLSFGASADFTRLEGIEFQVDLADADSAAAVDDVLQKLGITNGPLFEPALTDLLDTVNIVNRYANRGLDELMQQGLEAAVEEIGRATAPLTPNGQDPFITASELLTQVRSMPQQGVSLLAEEVRRPLNDQLAALDGRLDTGLQTLDQRIQNFANNPGQAERDALVAYIGELRETLEQVSGEARAIDASLGDATEDVTTLLGQAIVELNTINQAMDDVDLVMLQAVTFVDTACSNGFAVDAEGNGYLNDVAVRISAIRRVADIVGNTTQWLEAAETIAQNADVRERLATANQRIRDTVGELIGFVNAADQAVRDVVCQPQLVDGVVAEAFEVTQAIRDATGEVILLVGQNITVVQELDALRATFADRVLAPIDSLDAALEGVMEDIDNLDGARLDWVIACVLYDATHAGGCTAFPAVPAAVAPYGINAVHADAPGERDLSDLIFGTVTPELNGALSDAEDKLVAMTSGTMPGAYLTPEQLRRMLVTEIMRSQPVKDLRREMDKHFAEVAYAMNGIVLQIVDQVNTVVEEALAVVTGPINDALSEATSVVRGIPLKSAGMNGFATIAGNELERAHLSAGWTMRGSDDNDSTGFKAALDAVSWSAIHTQTDEDTRTPCNAGANESLLDVQISAYGLPISVLSSDIEIEKLYLGFTLQNGAPGGPALIPIGIFGGINTIGEIGFTDAIVFDPAFAAGLGTKQTYIGASAGAVFSDLTADVAFLVGRVCPGNTVLLDLDPSVEKFLPNLPASGFTGAYLRGGATIPIIPGGCALNVGVVADFGTWVFVGRPTTLGGLVGGGATGQIACIAALKGKATVGGSVSTDGDLKLTGEAWGVAGIGVDCDPGTWTSVPRSREDSWCGTGDAQFDASFDNGDWSFNPPIPSAIH